MSSHFSVISISDGMEVSLATGQFKDSGQGSSFGTSESDGVSDRIRLDGGGISAMRQPISFIISIMACLTVECEFASSSASELATGPSDKISRPPGRDCASSLDAASKSVLLSVHLRVFLRRADSSGVSKDSCGAGIAVFFLAF